ncbi:YjbH domain-containing protein [Caballeronia sp. ATUFL_M2_KS44]|uniref:YjbH domain-containing protein n=1 Tax=Caballeronia sp. ATUFL_M2_KS44 TaxID=2921767 RepID=UPI0020279287|nr:YjbH domain-containing protein [Caballeronia sp. ATUFL_M2_KS44]
MSSLGQAGGLVIPYAFALPEGTVEAQYNNYLDPRYGKEATGAQMYWGAVGLLPYVEVSGGLANYPGNEPAPFSGADHFVFRHLMADVKVQVPQFFRYQPAIAFGVTDVGGQTHHFRSKYGVVSQSFGPATLTIGYGQGERLNGLFGGVQVALGQTGLSLMAEDDSKTPYAGLRYQSPGIAWLGGASVVGTVLRSLRSTNGAAPRTSFSVGVQIPLGHRFDPTPAAQGTLSDAPMPENSHALNDASLSVPVTQPLNATSLSRARGESDGPLKTAVASSNESLTEPAALDAIAAQLFASGLERVRVGGSGQDLIVEYENHRYNQNEADAVGIVLGVASEHAPAGVQRIRAVIKKDNQVMGELAVDLDAYARFLASGAPGSVPATMTMRTRPGYDADAIAWHGDEHRHGLTRIEIQPVANYLYGTEYGNFDASFGAKVIGYVPLWKGAELVASYLAPFYHTANMDNGRAYGADRLRGGVTDVALAQSFWIAPQVLNVLAVGKFDRHYVGAENETTVFVPGRPDIVRLRLAYLHQQPGEDQLGREVNAALTYRWVQPAWKLWIEAGAARYVGGDKGPLITFTRWFDDVSFSVHAEHSGKGSYAGAAISFPLTPRQGMKPGLTQIDGASQFALDFRTRVGGINYVNANAPTNLDFAYSTQGLLLNAGRFSAEYFATQLTRMRDAYKRYAIDATGKPAAAQPRADARSQRNVSVSSATGPRTVCANFYRAVGHEPRQPDACK